MNKRGFTLIELIVTICVLSIIAVISFVSVTKIIESNKDENCKLIKNNIIIAVKDYVSDNRYDSNLKKDLEVNFLVDQKYLKGNIKNPYDNSNLELDEINIEITLSSENVPTTIKVIGLPNNCGEN